MALFSVPSPRAPRVPKGLGQYGSLRQPDDIYLFGTDAEIDNRNATGYNVSGTPPENMPPSFEQIRPGPTGKNMNEPGAEGREGTLKFGSARKYA